MRIDTASVRAALTLAVVVAPTATGCAHAIRVESDPPGAAVLVEDQPACQTPCTISEVTGREDLVVVEVKHADRAARFAYAKSGFSPEAVVASFALVGGGCLLAAGLGAGGLVAALFVAFGTGGAGAQTLVAFAAVAAAVYGLPLLAGFALAAAPPLVVATVGEVARRGPDRLHVDFRGEVPLVTSQPAGAVVPLVGRTRGAPQRY